MDQFTKMGGTHYLSRKRCRWFYVGGVAGAQKSVDEIMSKPIMIWALLICIAVLTPAGYYLAKWLSHKAFGQHLKLLKQNIDDLKEKN